MNQAECLNADWRLIGMEDGAGGHLPSYLGNHRSACAYYDVTPNLDAYMSGHKVGVKQYCTAKNGYNEGKRGDTYNGVCPQSLEIDFLPAYEHGYEHYQISKAIRDAESAIRYRNNDINDLNKEILELERNIIKEGTTAKQRTHWLKRIKDCQTQIGYLKAKISQYHDDIIVYNGYLNQHNLHHH